MLAQDDLELAAADRFSGDPLTLRTRAARGTLVNGLFLIVTNSLTLIKAIAVAGFLTTSQYGTWGLLMAAFMTILTLGSVGVDDKYVQQDDADQKRAFELAFTFQALLGVVFFIGILIGMPLFAVLYGRPQMTAPGLAFSLAIPALVLQMPIWVHYRRMDFARQRSLQVIDPVVSLVAVVGLAAAGLGVWALVCGELIGTWCAALAIVSSSPYRLRLRWDRQALREYTHFSYPLFAAAVGAVLLVQVPVAVSARVLGVAAVGGLALASNIGQFTSQVDNVVTQTLYPAICAVRDRSDLLFESFWKSNRLALLWAAPLGAAAALFAADFVHYVIGDKWHFAIPLIVAFGINAALNQIGFNWTAFLRAVGQTRPVGVVAAVQLVTMLVVGIPLLIADGLVGYGIGLIAATLVSVSLRLWYLRRLFPALAVVAHVARGMGPTLPGVAVVLAVRGADPGPGTPARVLVQALLFAIVVIGATLLTQWRLLEESLGYLRDRPSAVAGPGLP